MSATIINVRLVESDDELERLAQAVDRRACEVIRGLTCLTDEEKARATR